MAPQVVRLYNQMAEPKYVIAMGACAISGGPFKQGYNVLKGIDRYIPVDVHIPGCPPRPEALMQAFITLQKKIDAQPLTGEERPRHLDADAPGRVSGAGVWGARSGAADRTRACGRCQIQWLSVAGSIKTGTEDAELVKTVEEIKAAIEAAVPGAGVEIVPNASPSGSTRCWLERRARDGGGEVFAG